MKVREPVARPLDVVAAELLLSASQAFLTGVLMYLAIGVWDDRGVGTGPVAVILALFGLAVGGAWLYWLLGGVGWPMAAAATPVAMFLGFALVLGWLGQDLFELPGVPLLLAVVAAVYGIVCGVFLDSPRRWRWDQRQKLRPGTTVPRLSPATRTLAAAVPRSLPSRSRSTVTTSELAARIGHAPAVVHEPVAGVATPQAEADTDSGSVGGAVGTSGVAPAGSSDDVDGVATVAPEADGLAEAPGVEATPGAGAPRAVTGLTARPRPGDAGSATVAGLQRETDADGAIVLPTSVEPRATRSPWAWAAPPEWNRDEDDEAAGSGSSKRA